MDRPTMSQLEVEQNGLFRYVITLHMVNPSPIIITPILLKHISGSLIINDFVNRSDSPPPSAVVASAPEVTTATTSLGIHPICPHQRK